MGNAFTYVFGAPAKDDTSEILRKLTAIEEQLAAKPQRNEEDIADSTTRGAETDETQENLAKLTLKCKRLKIQKRKRRDENEQKSNQQQEEKRRRKHEKDAKKAAAHKAKLEAARVAAEDAKEAEEKAKLGAKAEEKVKLKATLKLSSAALKAKKKTAKPRVPTNGKVGATQVDLRQQRLIAKQVNQGQKRLTLRIAGLNGIAKDANGEYKSRFEHDEKTKKESQFIHIDGNRGWKIVRLNKNGEWWLTSTAWSKKYKIPLAKLPIGNNEDRFGPRDNAVWSVLTRHDDIRSRTYTRIRLSAVVTENGKQVNSIDSGSIAEKSVGAGNRSYTSIGGKHISRQNRGSGAGKAAAINTSKRALLTETRRPTPRNRNPRSRQSYVRISSDVGPRRGAERNWKKLQAAHDHLGFRKTLKIRLALDTNNRKTQYKSSFGPMSPQQRNTDNERRWRDWQKINPGPAKQVNERMTAQAYAENEVDC
eukprot:gene614-28643_t